MSLNKFRWGLTSLFEFGQSLEEFGQVWMWTGFGEV